MKRKIIKICIFFVLVCIIGSISNLSAEEINGATPPLVIIDCGNIYIDTEQDPDLCICVPEDHYNINVGEGGIVQVEVDFEIDCTSWDDHGYVKIWFVEWPSINDSRESGEHASGKLTISQVIPANTEFNVGLYAKIWYDWGGQGSECIDYGHCSTAPIPNHPPNKPSRPSGPTSVKKDVIYTWSSSSTDPDGDNIYMIFYWGDGTDSGWLGPYASGQIVYAEHSYAEVGFYEIRTQAKDIPYDESSLISDPLAITCKKATHE
ncbi:MAG: hypothetical protein ACQXXF_05010 [Thermoplasmatota archaeon]